RLDRRQRAKHDLAGAAVEGDDVPLGDGDLAPADVDREAAALVVDLEGGAAGDGALAHPAGDDGRVRCHAAALGKDAPGDAHAVDVLGAGLLAHEDDVLAHLEGGNGVARSEDDLAGGGAGRG